MRAILANLYFSPYDMNNLHIQPTILFLQHCLGRNNNDLVLYLYVDVYQPRGDY